MKSDKYQKRVLTAAKDEGNDNSQHMAEQVPKIE